MGVLKVIGRLLLLGLAVVGFCGLFKLAGENGFLDMIDKNLKARTPVIASTTYTLQTKWTGIAPIDAQINLSVSFFAPIFQGYHPKLSLATTHFYGTLVSLWVMLLLESYRVGNLWSIISFAMIWGILIENIGMAIFFPVWCILHLTLSPTVDATQTPSVRRRSLLVHPTELKVIPWSVFIGLGIPSAAILYCDANVLRPYYLSQQFWIVIRQINPLITSVVHLLLSLVISSKDATFGSPTKRNIQVLAGLQRIYRFATYIAVASHVITCTISLGSIWQPTIFSVKLVQHFHPLALLKPVSFLEVEKVKTIAEGAFRFIQWDAIITSTSALVWAITLNREALMNEPEGSSFPKMLFNVAKYTVFGGPAAATIFLMRERDEVLLGRVEDDDVKKIQ